jgi:hypothetical protein
MEELEKWLVWVLGHLLWPLIISGIMGEIAPWYLWLICGLSGLFCMCLTDATEPPDFGSGRGAF